MGLGEVTREGVLAAVGECRRLGRETFLQRYGFRRAVSYELVLGGDRYDSKAIVGVAHLYSTGTLLRAGEFSGGAVTVARRLRALGFVVEDRRAVPQAAEPVVPQDSRTSDSGNPPAASAPLTATDLLVRLTALNTHRNPTNRSPSRHQPLTLLWAISRAAAGEPRLAPWSDFHTGVRPLLAEFGLPSSKATPEYPFWHLRGSGLWEVHGIPSEAGSMPQVGVFNTVQPVAGLTYEVAELLRDPVTRLEAIAKLRTTYLEDIDQLALLSRVGLDGYATAGGLLDDVEDVGNRETTDVERATGPTERRESTSSRLVRNAALANQVKELYDSTCQVCATRLQYKRRPYSEAAHIRGLGSPHDGPDELLNLLCLCPNHHVLFDGLEIYIDADGVVRRTHGGESLGRLRRHANHPIDEAHLRYHRTLCELNA